MLNYLTQVSWESGADTILVELRESNKTAIKLYLSADFDELGVRRSYYPDHNGREDAFIYRHMNTKWKSTLLANQK